MYTYVYIYTHVYVCAYVCGRKEGMCLFSDIQRIWPIPWLLQFQLPRICPAGDRSSVVHTGQTLGSAHCNLFLVVLIDRGSAQ